MKTAVIIPCYKVREQILSVLSKIGKEIDLIVVVDDKCPQNSGKFVQENCTDQRVSVIFNSENRGVGGAVKSGFEYAKTKGVDIFIKLDGDGQMPPHLIKKIINPILKKEADYVKGNRFYNLESLRKMPAMRILGNSLLSLVNKFVNGYWDIMDPTNGFIAIHKNALALLPLEKIENRYFFESDMLFRLSTVKAVVIDVPMQAYYADEKSNLSISQTAFTFPLKYINRFFKRIFYNYFLRDFNVATLEMLSGSISLLFGIFMTAFFWIRSSSTGIVATTGQVTIASLPILIGFILLLMALHIDIISVPKKPLITQDFDE